MKKAISIVLAILLLSSLSSAFAVDAGEARAVLGADLSEEEVAEIYRTLGMERGGVKELTLTNAEEHALLDGKVAKELIGSRSISSIFLRVLQPGEGYQIVIGNVNRCTEDMYRNALVTAGITDVELVVTAPYPVSGTAALAGIYKAWEDMNGTSLSEELRSAGIEEFVLTRRLTEETGDLDIAGLVNELKSALEETKDMDDDALKEKIRELGKERGIEFNDTQLDELRMLCRTLEKLDSADLAGKAERLRQKAQGLGETAEKLREGAENVSSWLEKARTVLEKLVSFLRGAVESVKNLF